MTDSNPGNSDCVAFTIGEQLFGLPITGVHEVFEVTRNTRGPLAPPGIKGLVNPRGRSISLLTDEPFARRSLPRNHFSGNARDRPHHCKPTLCSLKQQTVGDPS